MHANANLFLRRQYPASRVVSFISSKIRDGVQNRLADSIYNNFPWMSRGREGSRCVVPARIPKRRSGIIVFSAVEHTTAKTPCRPLRTTDTDGIKSSEARGGWRGELKFSNASTAPPILHSPVLTGTWQRDCSLSARVNALALCKPSIGKIDGHLTSHAAAGEWRCMTIDGKRFARDFVRQKHRPPSAAVRI